MHEKAFSIHHLFLLLKVQSIKCFAAAKGDGGGDMGDRAGGQSEVLLTCLTVAG